MLKLISSSHFSIYVYLVECKTYLPSVLLAIFSVQLPVICILSSKNKNQTYCSRSFRFYIVSVKGFLVIKYFV